MMEQAPQRVTVESPAVAERAPGPGGAPIARGRSRASGNLRRGRESAARPTPSLDRALAFIRREIGAGAGFPTPTAIARAMGWRSERSARDALRRLERLGLIRSLGVEQRGGKAFGAGRRIWALTLRGQAPLAKWCERCFQRKPAAAFAPSEAHADGLEPVCRDCSPSTARAA